MANSHQNTPSVDFNESLPYGFAKGLSKALDTFLTGRDPKHAKAKRNNSSAGRARKNVIEAAPEIDLIGELLKRARKLRTRKMSRERQRRHREKLSRLNRAPDL